MASELHTSLESFLLFLSLQAAGQETLSFAKISESLRQNDILRKSDTFDDSRLEPDKLQNLYLRVLKEEAKAQIRRDQDEQTPLNPRKRKLSSPRLETLEEAAQYAHLLPQLVDSLYFRYQRDAITAIQEEEQEFRSLQGKSGELERGEQQGRQQNPEPSSRPSSHGVPSIQTLLRHEEEKGAQEAAQGRPSKEQNGRFYPDPAQPMLNGARPPSRPSVGSEARLPSNDPRYAPPGGYRPISAENGLPYLPPPQHPAQGYALPMAGQDAHRRRPSQPVPSPSPRLRQGSIPPPERSSASPVILPPVPGMLRSQASPTGPLDSVAEVPSQPYRQGPNMSPRPNQPPLPRPHGTQPPPNRNYTAQPYPYDNQQYPNYHPYNPGYYPPQYPPGPAPNGPHGSPYSGLPTYPSPVPSHPSQHAGYYPSPGYYNPSAMSTPHGQQQPSRYATHHTPMSNASARGGPLRSTASNVSTSSTKWKYVESERNMKRLGSPVRPSSRSVSPLSDRATSPEQEPTPARRVGAKGMNKETAYTKSSKPGYPRGGRGGRRGRGGHTSSRGRTRSHSVTSQTDEVTIDAKASATRRIKAESSVTSAHDDETSTMDEASRKPARRQRGAPREDDQPATPRTSMKRKRGESTLPLPSPSLRSTSGAVQPTTVASVTRRPGFILATRNMNRTSSALMQNVNSHKDAYLFAKAVNLNHAPNYDKVVLRPQDLKSIKAALAAGSRAVAAHVEEAGESVSAGAKSIWVPESEDVMPPKAIVNAGQLEKELLRIFANAVMYNADLAENRGIGPALRTRARTLEQHKSGANADAGDEETEGVRAEIGIARSVEGQVVKEARAMCADVEKTVDEWKGIGTVDAAEARDAPVLSKLRGGGVEDVAGEDDEHDEGDGDEVAGDGGSDGEEPEEEEEKEKKDVEKEASEEPRPKRRRRQL